MPVPPPSLQRMVEDAIDPEAAMAAQLAAADARAAEAQADRREMMRASLAFWLLFACLAMGHEAAADLGTQLSEFWLDWTFH